LHVRGYEIRFVYESLEKENVPLRRVPVKIKDKNGQERTVYYNIIAAIDETSAIDILQRDSARLDLKINPVTVIAGPKTVQLPNKKELASDAYGSIGKLISEARGMRWMGRGKNGITTADIIEGSPVGIYGDGHRHFYRKDQEAEARTHFETRMRELGII